MPPLEGYQQARDIIQAQDGDNLSRARAQLRLLGKVRGPRRRSITSPPPTTTVAVPLKANIPGLGEERMGFATVMLSLLIFPPEMGVTLF